ncbi:hypothetical protein [Solicola gregarius]|uniref:Uncharacterized protein n=1 Tax=Solicola gregarius TaxID=2908642 RepID=A0AA46YL83_9ACTN|nr:hypothetical protein [Solicola gregarius]UYM06645.1 hypothetical protein L0C25_06120 [Solicola gregarius]
MAEKPRRDRGQERPEQARHRREKQATEVFGDLLPEGTRDESAQSWGDRDDSRDDELLRDVPPHHG